MNSFAITLVLISTLTHASWNLLARRRRSEVVFFRRMLLLVAVVGFLPAVLSEVLTRPLTLRAWIYILPSGTFCGLYSFFLARAYGDSDFTIVYPLVRALPVLIIGLGDMLRGRYPTLSGWLGMACVVTGCFLAPLESIRGFAIKGYFNKASGWMILAAMAMVGYSILDKVAAESITAGPAAAASYGYFYFLVCYVVYEVAVRTTKRQNHGSDPVGWRTPAAAGLLNFFGYWLVLWAFQLSQRASYVVAFRQFSIAIGVVVAFLVYKEKGVGVRLLAVSLITLGLVIISLWG